MILIEEGYEKVYSMVFAVHVGSVPAGAQKTDAKAPAAKETKSDVKEASIVFDKTTQDWVLFRKTTRS